MCKSLNVSMLFFNSLYYLLTVYFLLAYLYIFAFKIYAVRIIYTKYTFGLTILKILKDLFPDTTKTVFDGFSLE